MQTYISGDLSIVTHWMEHRLASIFLHFSMVPTQIRKVKKRTKKCTKVQEDKKKQERMAQIHLQLRVITLDEHQNITKTKATNAEKVAIPQNKHNRQRASNHVVNPLVLGP